MSEKTTKSPKEIYKVRLQYKGNYNEVENTFDTLLNNLLHSIKIDSKNDIKINTRLLLFLLGTFAETFLLSFLNGLNSEHKPYFTNDEIEYIAKLDTQEKKWEQTIKYAMEKKLDDEYQNLSRTDTIIFDDLIKTFEFHISPVIRLRNKMAHGQFIHIINGEPGLQKSLYNENYISLKYKRKILKQLINCLISIISSDNTITDDYNSFYEKIENILVELKNNNFDKWKISQQEKYQKGLKFKAENILKNQ